MHVEVQLTREPIVPAEPTSLCGGGADGAWAEFTGRVRAEEDGDPIAALEYEAYEVMAAKVMHEILTQLGQLHVCSGVRVIHRLGVVPAKEAALWVGVSAPHRREAFALLTAFLDELKRHVPIWKIRALPCSSVSATRAPDRDDAGGQAVSLDEVIALVRDRAAPLEVEQVPLSRAAGRFLRERIQAPEDQPPFDRSAMDGYAVREDDSSTSFRIVDRVRAGDWKPRRLQRGEAVRIATGGALPCDGLEVVIAEHAQVVGEQLKVLQRSPSKNIRSRGEDARAGHILAQSGLRLTPGALALLAGLGRTRPAVTRLPRVVHLVTGDEIVAPHRTPAKGQVRDSNSSLVRAFLAQWGVVPQQLRVPEDRVRAEFTMTNQADDLLQTDMLLISGGVSVGPDDFTAELLEAFGYTLHVRSTTTRPGKPLIFGSRGRALAFGLPGNPLAHFVCLNLYVRPALEGLSGAAYRKGFLSGRLAVPFKAQSHVRETLWPARWRSAVDGTQLTPLVWRSSGDLTSLATATALIRIPPQTDHLPAGAIVQFIATSVDA